MPRAKRGLRDEAYYHILVRGNNDRAMFHQARDYQAYLDLLRRYVPRFPDTRLHHYCLVPKSAHLLVRVGVAAEFPRLMQGLNQSYGHYYRRTYPYTGHLFRGRYRSIQLAPDHPLVECARYVERTPVRAELVRDLRHHRWSSYPYYANGTPDPSLVPSPFYAELGVSPEERRLAYQRYLLESRPYDRLLDRQLARAAA